jgi:hypothetical protein
MREIVACPSNEAGGNAARISGIAGADVFANALLHTLHIKRCHCRLGVAIYFSIFRMKTRGKPLTARGSYWT